MSLSSSAALQTSAMSAWLDSQLDELRAQIHQALRATMFSNRFEMRPAQFGRIAADESLMLSAFLAQPDPATAIRHGNQLCHKGLGEESVLKIAQVTRRFLLDRAPEPFRLQALEIAEIYHNGVTRGFIKASTALTLEEQERIRSALQRTLRRYSVQMAVAAEVARAATSILDLDTLLQTAVELIRERFNLYYVAIFLTDTDNRWAYLQASSGEAGQVTLRRGHRLKIGGDSLVGWCIAHGEHRIALDVGEKAISFDTPLLTDIHSEMVIPLISRGKVIGAMAIQSRQVGAFSEQDVAVTRITADQLANAIENARLFRERERQIRDLSLLNEVGRSLSSALSFSSLVETIYQQVGRIYDVTHFVIATNVVAAANVADPDLWKQVYNGREGRLLPLFMQPHGKDVISFIARHRESVLLNK